MIHDALLRQDGMIQLQEFEQVFIHLSRKVTGFDFLPLLDLAQAAETHAYTQLEPVKKRALGVTSHGGLL
jgi:hypothetical protein